MCLPSTSFHISKSGHWSHQRLWFCHLQWNETAQIAVECYLVFQWSAHENGMVRVTYWHDFKLEAMEVLTVKPTPCVSLSLICKTNVRCIQPWALGAAYPWEADLAESINAVSCIEHDVPAHKFQTFCTTTGGCIPLPFQQWLTASEDICWLWQANQVLDISLEPVRWIFWVKSGVHWTDPTLFICHGLSKLCMDLRLSSIMVFLFGYRATS